MTEQEFKAEFDKLKGTAQLSGRKDKQFLKIAGVCISLLGEIDTAEVPENLFEGFSLDDRKALVAVLISGLTQVLAGE